jgi:hypothetical protein
MNTMRIGRSIALAGVLVSAFGSVSFAASVERFSSAVEKSAMDTTVAAISPEEATRAMLLPAFPPAANSVLERVERPEDLDPVSKELNVPAQLINFHMATLSDLGMLGLGQAVYLPVAISEREGGRESLYFLRPGQEVLAGIFVTNSGIALRYVKRETGSELPAQSGDVYTERLTTREGKALFAGQGKLEVVDPSIGRGRVVLTQTPRGERLPTQTSFTWWGWSFILTSDLAAK